MANVIDFLFENRSRDHLIIAANLGFTILLAFCKNCPIVLTISDRLECRCCLRLMNFNIGFGQQRNRIKAACCFVDRGCLVALKN